ncbi:MAG: pilus assembly protein PilM [Oceanobacter sp.]
MIGIDISSTAVKVIELSKQGDDYQVEAYASESLPPNAIIEQNISNDEEVGEAVKRALSKSGSKATNAAIAVAGSSVIIKTIQMNSNLNEFEMDFQIRAEADQYIPYPLDEVALDWEVVGQVENNPDSVNVLLVACRSETVERRKDAVEYADLEAQLIDVELYCIERSMGLLHHYLDGENVQTVAVIDIGATMTTLSVLHEGSSVYTREQLFGGRQLVEDIMRLYGLDEPQATAAVGGEGLPASYQEDTLQPFLNAVVQQVSRSLQFFYSSSPYNDVDYIVLAGGTASLGGLSELITEELGIPAMVANPFKDMTVAKNIDHQLLLHDAPSLMVACGLAMRGFN